ncbi:hypothetical protein QUF72_22545 [Desulfobacterales bacterium HSG2]|nr:hypothetical protein [Desulfobacterales bacterium HSG2]
MSKFKLEKTDVKHLEIFVNPLDLRKSLHRFLNYVENRRIKRTARGNHLPKTEAKKLIRLITDATRAPKEPEFRKYSRWIDYVDRLALKLGFITYNTKGRHKDKGNSTEESYPNNHIEFRAEKYNPFMTLSHCEQEVEILETLTESYKCDDNELLQRGAMGRLDTFGTWGCATGVLPFLNFAESRIMLFDILKQCQSGVWYSTASLIQYLRSEHPWFLIPEKPKYKYKTDSLKGRYGNFHEIRGMHEIDISPKDPDAFERVEGRYAERFLEGIPLAMGYADVAYGKSDYKNRYPSINKLKAFRVNEHFLRFMQGYLPEPKVTVQPNFEIHIESAFYPLNIFARLTPLTDLVSEDTVTILKLNRKKVTAQLAKDASADAADLLKSFADTHVPQNILTELREWAGHSEKFVLYDGFGLLEGDPPDLAGEFALEAISPEFSIVRSPDRLSEQMETSELAPVLVRHGRDAFTPLPDEAMSIFPKKSGTKAKPKKKESVTLYRKTSVTLYFPTRSLLEKCRKWLIQANCPIEADVSGKCITYAAQDQALADAALEAMQKNDSVQIEDIEL